MRRGPIQPHRAAHDTTHRIQLPCRTGAPPMLLPDQAATRASIAPVALQQLYETRQRMQELPGVLEPPLHFGRQGHRLLRWRAWQPGADARYATHDVRPGTCDAHHQCISLAGDALDVLSRPQAWPNASQSSAFHASGGSRLIWLRLSELRAPAALGLRRRSPQQRTQCARIWQLDPSLR